ncbi:hypothetical protein Tco_0292823, partial [Tanacetum coccineum]
MAIESRHIGLDEPPATSESSWAPSTTERSPLDFSNKNSSEQINEGDGAKDQGSETMASVVPPAGPSSTMEATPNIVKEEEMVVNAPLVRKRCRKRANKESNANASRKVGGELHHFRTFLTGDSGRYNESRPNIVHEALVRPGARYCPV